MKMLLVVSLLSTVALSPARARAQLLCALGSTSSFEAMSDMPAGAEAQADVKRLKALLCPKGCGKLFVFANPTAPQSATATDGHGASKIVYSPAFVAEVRKSYGPLGSFGLFAHQLGHHLDAIGNRPAWMKGAWDGELRADAWAGCAMAKAELKPSGLQASLLVLAEYPSPRHPAWNERRDAITEGYKQCGGAMLPKLARESAKETPEASATVLTSAESTVAPAGCASDKECRNGRVCLQRRCAAAPERRRCGKDTDCPDPQECDAAGVCAVPGGQAQGAQPQAAPAGPLLAAALQTETTRAAPASDPASCLRACDDARNQCVEATYNEGNKCLSTIQAEAGYRSCTCPTYPANNAGCRDYCVSAYERGKVCASSGAVQSCHVEGDRCRAKCH
jgi:hypothetical protein